MRVRIFLPLFLVGLVVVHIHRIHAQELELIDTSLLLDDTPTPSVQFFETDKIKLEIEPIYPETADPVTDATPAPRIPPEILRAWGEAGYYVSHTVSDEIRFTIDKTTQSFVSFRKEPLQSGTATLRVMRDRGMGYGIYMQGVTPFSSGEMVFPAMTCQEDTTPSAAPLQTACVFAPGQSSDGESQYGWGYRLSGNGASPDFRAGEDRYRAVTFDTYTPVATRPGTGDGGTYELQFRMHAPNRSDEVYSGVVRVFLVTDY